MPLPNNEKVVPQFTIHVPSTNQPIKCRPFLVKEEKVLLIALESGEEKEALDSVLQTIHGCVLSPLDMDTLADFDIEYLFLQLRARSVNNNVELTYKCNNMISLPPDEAARIHKETIQCNNLVTVKINLDDIKVKFDPTHTKKIFLTDTMGITMKYPSYKDAKAKEGSTGIEKTLYRIASCVESVFDEESVYTNFSLKEIQTWIENLTRQQFAKVEHFFATLPKLSHDFEFFCPKCNYKETMHIEGLASFFV